MFANLHDSDTKWSSLTAKNTYAVIIFRVSLIYDRVSRKLATSRFIFLLFRSHWLLDIFKPELAGVDWLMRQMISLTSFRVPIACTSLWFIRPVTSRTNWWPSLSILQKISWAKAITARKSEILKIRQWQNTRNELQGKLDLIHVLEDFLRSISKAQNLLESFGYSRSSLNNSNDACCQR